MSQDKHNKDQRENPFVRAGWGGEECAKCIGEDCTFCQGTGRIRYWGWWNPEPTNGTVVISKENGDLDLVVKGVECGFSNIGGVVESIIRGSNLPLLPSIYEINQQADPRGAAIVALERVGFARGHAEYAETLYCHVGYGETIRISFKGRVAVDVHDCDDPDRIHYAAACSRVFGQWVGGVDWSVVDGSK